MQRSVGLKYTREITFKATMLFKRNKTLVILSAGSPRITNDFRSYVCL